MPEQPAGFEPLPQCFAEIFGSGLNKVQERFSPAKLVPALARGASALMNKQAEKEKDAVHALKLVLRNVMREIYISLYLVVNHSFQIVVTRHTGVDTADSMSFNNLSH